MTPAGGGDGDAGSGGTSDRVRHDPAAGRFSIPLDDGEARMDYEGPEDGTVDFRSTFVSPDHRGRGLAEEIVLTALRWARDEGLTVVPTCPYVRSVMTEKHPEFASLAAEAGEGDAPDAEEG